MSTSTHARPSAAAQALDCAAPSPSSAPMVVLSLGVAFFVSGLAALIYQVCWNRYLYAAIGVDLDSTTVIVAAFMLGLGLGNGVGAWVATRRPSLRAFVVIELLLLVFGASSALWMPVLSDALSALPRSAAASVAFAVLLVPTLLMGATLPVMTEAAQQHRALRHIAFSTLYLWNTVGAGAGALLCTFVLLGALGLKQSIWFAAAANALAAFACVLSLALLTRAAKLASKRSEQQGPQ